MKQKLTFTILILVLFSILSSGQSIKVGIGGGYTALTGDNELTAENMLNLSSGMHYGGKVVVGLPILPLQFTANVYQNSLSNDITYEGQSVESEIDFLSVGIGAEFNLLPGPVQPYLAGEVLFTSFGEPTLDGVALGDSESKTGIGVGAGVYFKLLPIIDLDLSAHYNMNTLLSDSDAMNSTHVRLNVLISIL